MSDAVTMTGHASWCDYVTFDTFLKKKVQATMTQAGDKYVLTYHCGSPLDSSIKLEVSDRVDVADNILVNVDFLCHTMEMATATLYQADSDHQGIVTHPEVPMDYSDCFNHVPPLEYKVIG